MFKQLYLQTFRKTDTCRAEYRAIGVTTKSVAIRLIASGGVASIQDVKKLNDMNIYGVIIGKALYEKTIDLEEVLEVTKLC